MVEQGRSPSPKERRPVQEWEVKAIPDAVEEWYAQGADSGNAEAKKPQPTTRPLSPPVPEQHEISEYENQSPVTPSETAELVKVAEQIVHGGASGEAQKERINDTVRALRAEDRILKFYAETYPDSATDAAEQLRADPLGFGLISASGPLHPYDAERDITRQSAKWFQNKLVYHTHEAMQEGRKFTRDDILDMYGRYQRREGEFEDLKERGELAEKQGHGSIDFSMENLYAVSERHMLAGHLMRDEKKRVDIMQPATIAVHELIESVLPQPVPVPNK